MEKKTKACPFCWEEILQVAKKCRYCGEFLEIADKNVINGENKEESIKEKEKIYKVYGKKKSVKYWTTLFWLLVWIILVWSWYNADGWWIAVFIWICCLMPIFQMLHKRLYLEEDQVVIEKWVFFKKFNCIKYSKINDIELRTFSNTIIIYTGNDKPVKFSWIDSPREILEYIQDKIGK